MSVATVLQSVDNDVKGFFAKLKADVQKAKTIWSGLSSPQTRALAIKLLADAVKVGKDADAAAMAGGMNFVLDSEAVTDIKQLVADAEAGDEVIKSDLVLLGVKI